MSHFVPHCPTDPDHRVGIWRVGSGLDSRIEGQRDLVALSSQPVIPPGEEKFYPALSSLRWREQHLVFKESCTFRHLLPAGRWLTIALAPDQHGSRR